MVSNTMPQMELEQYKTYEYYSFNKAAKVVVEDYENSSKTIQTQHNFYDAENMRYGIEEDGVRTNFVTNGWSVFTELDAEWKPTRRLVRGYGIVAGEDNGEYHYYHQNEHGDIEYITGAAGTVENAYTYDAFGNITNSAELVKNRYTYNGEQYDQISQQYYLRARYYNPLVGRFTQEDVYRGDGLNLYAYCGSNPVMYVDPSGYDANKCGTGSDGDDTSKFKYEHNPSENPKVLRDAIEDPNAVYGYRPNETGSIKTFADKDWSNEELVNYYRENRIKYHQENDVNIEIANTMRAEGKTDCQIAQALVERRNNNRLAAYMDENGNISDIDLYNQALEHCKTYEELKIGKTDLEIIESSTRGNPGMDACCGLYDDYYHTYN